VALRRAPAAIGPLKVWRLGPIEDAMARMFARLRTRFLMLALAFALVGQVIAPFAMAMPPDADSTVGMSLTPSGLCLNCNGMDHSKAIGCTVGVCSGVVAILPVVTAIDARPSASTPSVAHSGSRGITVRPETGPPRPLHLT
jgi:hypothetical protein